MEHVFSLACDSYCMDTINMFTYILYINKMELVCKRVVSISVFYYENE